MPLLSQPEASVLTDRHKQPCSTERWHSHAPDCCPGESGMFSQPQNKGKAKWRNVLFTHMAYNLTQDYFSLLKLWLALQLLGLNCELPPRILTQLPNTTTATVWQIYGWHKLYTSVYTWIYLILRASYTTFRPLSSVSGRYFTGTILHLLLSF